MNTICGAGFALTLTTRGNLKTLLIRDSLTGSWDFPKGEIEIGEQPIVAAVRELFEETGIKLNANRDLIFSPETFEYSIQPTLKKRVVVFPALLSNKLHIEPNVRLSEEHNAYLWANASELRELLNDKAEAAACIEQILIAISSYITHKQNASLASERLKEHLPRTLAAESWPKMHSWYLHGSFACAENTLSPHGFSDVDLVCISAKDVSFKNAVIIHDQVHRVVNSLHNNMNVSCGIYHLHPMSPALVREPQWTYFAAAHSLLIKNDIALAKINISSAPFVPNPEQEIPRVIWYRLLKAINTNSLEAEYSFVKGIIALALLRSYAPLGYEFAGYSALKHRVQSDLLLGRSAKVPYLSFLSALDYKLNYCMQGSNQSRRGEFIQICRDWVSEEANSLSQLTFDFCCIALDIIDERKPLSIASLTRVSNYLGLPPLTVKNIMTQFDQGDVSALMLTLAIFRVRHKGDDFKPAFPKYITLLLSLSSKLANQNRVARGLEDLLSLSSKCASHMKGVSGVAAIVKPECEISLYSR